jgi:hypothetical protein
VLPIPISDPVRKTESHGDLATAATTISWKLLATEKYVAFSLLMMKGRENSIFNPVWMTLLPQNNYWSAYPDPGKYITYGIDGRYSPLSYRLYARRRRIHVKSNPGTRQSADNQNTPEYVGEVKMENNLGIVLTL